MEQKIAFGFLNWGDKNTQRPNNVKRVATRISSGKKDVVFVCTNHPEEFASTGFNLIPADVNVSKCKNDLLDRMYREGFDWCFILEDDVRVTDPHIFSTYISIMESFDLDFICYGFDNKNSVLNNTRPNPILKIIDLMGRSFCFNRLPCSSVLGFRLKENFIRFDESLNAIETEFYVLDQQKSSGIPFAGFLIDKDESWNCFSRINTPTLRVRSRETVQNDVKKRKQQIALETSVDDVLKFLKEKTEKGIN